MKKQVLLAIIVLIITAIHVYGAGTCQLNKAQYTSGTTAVFTCSCTLPNEENVAVNIVFKNNNGTVLQNTTGLTTGLCRASYLTNSYIISYAGYNGSAYLETGNTYWNNADDIRTDTYEVLSSVPLSCIITDITGSQTINIGDVGAVKIKVQTSGTNHSLVGAYCKADGYSSGGLPIVFEPQNNEFQRTGSGGEVGFMHRMEEYAWRTNTTYLFEFHCHCPINGTGQTPDTVCYDETNGVSVGFLSCNTQLPFKITNNFNFGSERFKLIIIYLFGMLCFFTILSLWFYTMQNPLTYIFFISSLLVSIVISWVSAKYIETVNSPWQPLYWQLFRLTTIITVFCIFWLLIHWTSMIKDFRLKTERDKSKALFGEKFG